ncbi:polysaccharide deacetylase family protein [Cellulomonas hominis]|uniref:polysaccharide deacetylase family protein n=1 Tax=Cellulomonas hominis TaxID=156981 RepID=UPI001C0F6D39|nr:polysaccharide deacetylase family protein [Cellulomonas hominis]MBU5423930.1 polysaccharide deacetylase family protein [Cellulomonas hominis]
MDTDSDGRQYRGRPARPTRPVPRAAVPVVPVGPVGRGAGAARRTRRHRVAVGATTALALAVLAVVGLHGAHARAGTAAVAPSPTSAASPTSAPSPTADPSPAVAASPVEVAPAPDPAPAVDCDVARCVALTFDDGPGPSTAALLDELADRDVPATFFVIGQQAAARPDLVARERAEGHAVGNHTWDHPDLTTLAPDAVADELDRTARTVRDATGSAPVLVRPPYGAVDDPVLSVLAGRGETAVLWDVDTEDWKNRDVAETTRRALAGAHPGAIVLMHDIRPTTVQAVPGIVDELRAQGYTLVTVPELLGERVQPGAKVFDR